MGQAFARTIHNNCLTPKCWAWTWNYQPKRSQQKRWKSIWENTCMLHVYTFIESEVREKSRDIFNA